MFNIKKLLFLSLSISSLVACEKETPETNLILTTALIDNEHAQARKQEYIESLQQFRSLGYEQPCIVEGFQMEGPSFFNEFTEPDWYRLGSEKSMIENYATTYLKQAEQEEKISVYYLPSEENDFPLGIIVNPAHSSTGVPLGSQTKY